MRAFTLVELLVVIAIITMLLGILTPALSGVRRQATALLGMRDQREVASAVNLFALDNDDRYPQSVAAIGYPDDWHWYDPMMLTSLRKLSPQRHRAMSTYLRPYLPDATTVFCPAAPQKYKYLQESWDAGEDWDNPDTEVLSDPVTGTFCFYWSYTGFLGGSRQLFKGPQGPAAGGRQSQLLVSDYFGYGSWQAQNAFVGCERLPGAEIIPETWKEAALWTAPGDPNDALPSIKLRAAYVDGHVETYTPGDTVLMRISLTAEGVPPYADGPASRGLFYIPENAVH